MSVAELLLFLFAINLGTAFGAGIYETRIVLPRWFNRSNNGYRVNADAMRDIDTGRKFWGPVTTLPLTLLTLANLYFAWYAVEPARVWWLAAAAITLLERLGTFAFFIPTALRLQKADAMEPAKVSKTVSLWIGMNYLRSLMTLVGMVTTLRALMLL